MNKDNEELLAVFAIETVPTALEAGYQAVWDGGWLTEDAWANARIWRSVQAALEAYEATLAIDRELKARVWDECAEAYERIALRNVRPGGSIAKVGPPNPYRVEGSPS